jgi:hypothetical protein
MTGWRKRQVIEMAEKASPSLQDWWKSDAALEAFAELIRADEREACAKVCEPQEEHDDPLTAWKIAAAIRARGNT